MWTGLIYPYEKAGMTIVDDAMQFDIKHMDGQ